MRPSITKMAASRSAPVRSGRNGNRRTRSRYRSSVLPYTARTVLPRLAAILVAFPLTLVVFSVRQHMPNKNPTTVEVNVRNQTVFVSADVEHHKLANPIRSEDTRLNSSHEWISYAVFCLKKKTKTLT